MKRVLVAGPDRLDNYLEPYCAALKSVGVLPVRTWPSAFDSDTINSLMVGFDGLLLPGGSDVHPRRYGEQPHGNLKPTDDELDTVHLELARQCVQLNIPTLAICRGMQVVGVAFGATLFQDLPSQQPNCLRHEVRVPREVRRAGGGIAHEVSLSAGSALEAIVGVGVCAINSRHHQAVRESSPGICGQLIVVGRAMDGVVEAVSHPQHQTLLAVQWHPEDLVGTEPASTHLFEAFAVSVAG